MPRKVTKLSLRLNEAVIRDLDLIAEHYGGMDRTNTVRALIAEKKSSILAARERLAPKSEKLS